MCPFRAEHYDHVQEGNDDVHEDNTHNNWGDHRCVHPEEHYDDVHREELIEDNIVIMMTSFGSVKIILLFDTF